MKSIRTVLGTASVLLLAGCAADDSTQQANEELAEDSATMAKLSEGRIARLAELYPVLGEERVGEPQPNGDAAPPPPSVKETVEGEATFYADHFEGRRTASGIPFRQNQLVAAHRGFPFGTLLRVTNLRNGKAVNVRVVDRGPHGGVAKSRNTIIDLSRRAAQTLEYVAQGRAPVRVEVLEWGEGLPNV